MQDIPYVRQEEFDLAREMEHRLLTNPAAGVLFAGVDVKVDLVGGRTVQYQAWLGIRREFDSEESIQMALQAILQAWYPQLDLVVQVHRGRIT